MPGDRQYGGRAAIDRPWLASGSPRAQTPELGAAPAKTSHPESLSSSTPRAEVGDATLAEAFQSTLDRTGVSESDAALEPAPDAAPVN